MAPMQIAKTTSYIHKYLVNDLWNQQFIYIYLLLRYWEDEGSDIIHEDKGTVSFSEPSLM
jgi:hypothetical protein